MKKCADFLVFSDDYGRHPSSCQHLMRRFLPDNRILWVNTVGLRRPVFSFYDFFRGLEIVARRLRPLRRAGENLWVYSPATLPWSRFAWVRRRNRRRGVAGVRRALRKLGMREPVSLTTVPNVSDWIGEFGEKLKVYYRVDDFSQWPGMEGEAILRMERELLAKSDLTVCASEKLTETGGGAAAVFLPHGVDLEHFKKAFSEMRPQGKPRVAGYFGLVDERLDFPLLERLAREHPEWEWRFLGPLQSCPDSLRRMKNCRFLPPVAYDSLPEAIASWDALILPYADKPVVRAMNPLKLRECLATGKPVVSRDMPWARPYAGLLQACRDAAEFSRALNRIASGGFKADPQAQWRRMAEESWEARARTLLGLIEGAMRQKNER